MKQFPYTPNTDAILETQHRLCRVERDYLYNLKIIVSIDISLSPRRQAIEYTKMLITHREAP